MKRPVILLNFIALKSGGGVQVGVDFLSHVKNSTDYEWHLIATAGTAFDEITEADGVASIVRSEGGIKGRFIAEVFTLRYLVKKIKPQLIFTLFGPGPLLIFDPAIKTISGCAYSNLFYPEIDFWKNSGFPLKQINKFIDVFRLLLTRRADLVVFETSDIRERAIQLRKFDPDRVCVVKPSVSNTIKNHLPEEKHDRFYLQSKHGFKIVMISYYRYHKNIDLFPYILRYLEESYGLNDIFFVLTLEPDHPGTKSLIEIANVLGVSERIINIGPISPESCSEIYSIADISILPSTLESFSNNIAESWASSVPLLTTDRSWARSICGNAAMYAKHRDVKDIGDKIYLLYRDENARINLIKEGHIRLSEYPTSSERFFFHLQNINNLLGFNSRDVHAS